MRIFLFVFAIVLVQTIHGCGRMSPPDTKTTTTVAPTTPTATTSTTSTTTESTTASSTTTETTTSATTTESANKNPTLSTSAYKAEQCGPVARTQYVGITDYAYALVTNENKEVIQKSPAVTIIDGSFRDEQLLGKEVPFKRCDHPETNVVYALESVNIKRNI
ncbi:hypothetical protein QR680_006888 [Steinernema hermaphroditum]|uniref:Uncharacterized protein n=1 Tax=Steinernema hermaphroditum TaxID=289476 RepID=A0AA39HWY3_9BILA|nr:hypothetical protein QR680_006888 [Steinernema hermaphroditum]